VEEKVVHFYNVILGKIPCGAQSNEEERNFSVFPSLVSCEMCLEALQARVQPPRQETRERTAA
jgi:hypothetical protein